MSQPQKAYEALKPKGPLFILEEEKMANYVKREKFNFQDFNSIPGHLPKIFENSLKNTAFGRRVTTRGGDEGKARGA